MDHIRVIQEVVDAHKEDMPTGVTTRVMEECQKAYNELPALYKLVQAYVDGGGLARSHRVGIEHVEDEEDIACGCGAHVDGHNLTFCTFRHGACRYNAAILPPY